MNDTIVDWDDIDTILLDMDGTLLDLHFDNYFWLTHLPKRYGELHGISADEATEHILPKVKEHEGTLNWYCLDFWSAALKVNVGELKREIQHKIQIRPYVEAFLKAAKKMNKKLVLITNAHQDSLNLKLEITKIDQWLDVVLSSHQFKYPKEQQEFWHSLHQLEKFNPEKTLFIDDTVRILRAAQDFGIKHLLCIHQPDSQQKREIVDFPAIHHFDEIIPN
ncbi:GMP/IMP nucleotidase [Sessilibacter sp. MAH1]